jgi:hypothetical protein
MLSIDLPATSRISGTDYPLPALVNAEHRPYQKKPACTLVILAQAGIQKVPIQDSDSVSAKR